MPQLALQPGRSLQGSNTGGDMGAAQCGQVATLDSPQVKRLSEQAYRTVINISDSKPTEFGAMLISILPGIWAIDDVASYVKSQSVD